MRDLHDVERRAGRAGKPAKKMPYEIRKFGSCTREQSKCVRVCKKQTTKCFSNKNVTKMKAMKQLQAIMASERKAHAKK